MRAGFSRYDCRYCGKNIRSDEWHSHESCLLYMIDNAPERLSAEDHALIRQRGEEAIRERVSKKVLA